MTSTDIIIAIVFIACCLICYAKGIRDGRADERKEAEVAKPGKERRLRVVYYSDYLKKRTAAP